MSEKELIEKAKQGDKHAVNALLIKHQDFIFNVSLKMLNDVSDAQDATQEVLIKVLTNLSSFDVSKAKFTTWVYRITFNHIINFKKSAWEKTNVTFENFFQFMENIPDVDIPENDEHWTNNIEETKVTCTSGMLMCLDREQRLIYIIGDIFKVDQSLAAEIFDTSATNFRKKLSRARKDLHQWMHNKCGLVNTDNPCRCRNKTKKLIEIGEVDSENKKWMSGYKDRIEKHTQSNIEQFGNAKDEIYNRIFQEHPFKTNLKANEIYYQILDNKDFSKFMNL
jgi:RNA polymerase sigma factor (sigma-70 family)